MLLLLCRLLFIRLLQVGEIHHALKLTLPADDTQKLFTNVA